VATVAVYQWWWGLLLAAATTALVALVTPAGWWSRLPLALGFAGTIALTSIPRGEGDYLVASTGGGYVVLALAVLVLGLAIATLPRPGDRSVGRQSGEKPASE